VHMVHAQENAMAAGATAFVTLVEEIGLQP
jgi:hypothetical protein